MTEICFIMLCFALMVGMAVSNAEGGICGTFFDCISCTTPEKYKFGAKGCTWMREEGVCTERKTRKGSEVVGSAVYGDQCEVQAPPDTTMQLADWMQSIFPAIKSLTLLDLSLPGTHDTMTYDLSLKTSDGGVDGYDTFAHIMHNASFLLPGGVEDFIRQQAITQKLTVTEQLDAGVRFLDFRIMQETDDVDGEWRSLHFLETYGLALDYLKQVRSWMDVHPGELVVLWLSKHGSTCSVGQDAYPGVSPADKQAFWQEIVDVFGSLMVDFSQAQLNTTTISELVDAGMRLAVYASDYDEFTGGANTYLGRFALDGCLIDNRLGPGLTDEAASVQWERDMFANADTYKQQDKAQQGLLLMSMAIGVPTVQVTVAARDRWGTGAHDDGATARCVAALSSPPGMQWCPPTLLDVSQLDNYYRQQTLEEAYVKAESEGWGFPHAIYLNGLDFNGLIRTGTKVLWGEHRKEDSSEDGAAHETSGYAYAATFVAYNVRRGCRRSPDLDESDCLEYASPYEQIRSKHPMLLWKDTKYGRTLDWQG